MTYAIERLNLSRRDALMQQRDAWQAVEETRRLTKVALEAARVAATTVADCENAIRQLGGELWPGDPNAPETIGQHPFAPSVGGTIAPP